MVKRKTAAWCILWLLLLFGLCSLCSALCVQADAAEKPSVSASSAVLIEAKTGKVLYGLNEHERRSMASTTKIMSALLTLEAGELDTMFTVDSQAIHVEGSSMGLREGDQVSLRTLAYGMLLASGNDAANAAAVAVAGSVEEFVDCMNERADQVGMTNTHFVTPSGLDAEEHYSTAYDMALLAREALQNADFYTICSSEKVRLSYGNPAYNRWMTNHNKLLSLYEGAIGVKTGFTKKSGRCLVSAAQRNGVTLIAVTLNAPDDWNDHQKLFDYGFSKVENLPMKADLSGVRLPVVGGVTDTAMVAALQADTIIFDGNQQNISQTILLEPFCYAPIDAGERVGCVQFWQDGILIGQTDILAAQNVPYEEVTVKKTLWDQIKEFFTGLFRIQ
ncbi:MAG TPA: D-alanyl-D-alanine carboxypeptidase [Firmicutes bacterium]|nr:D-alanyl-D-alanine carboxypeptidase [Bacillota bacterium]